jgi:hypothetical protein
MDRIVRHHAEGAAAVRDHLTIPGELIEVLLQLGKRNRPGALDMTGIELIAGADVDHDDVAPPHPPAQLDAVDPLDLVPEVVPCRTFHLGQALG